MASWLFLLTLSSITASAPEDQDRFTESIRIAFEANRAVLSHGVIRFTLTIGKSASANAAVRGKITDKYVADGAYYYNEERARYECIFSSEDMASESVNLGGGRSSTKLNSFRLLTDGKVTLLDFMDPPLSAKPRSSLSTGRQLSSFSHTTQIDPGTDVFFTHALLPIGLGNPAFKDPLAALIGASSRHQEGWTLSSIDDHVQVEGEDATLLTFESTDTGTRRKFWVDLTRGAISRLNQSFSKDGRTTHEFFYGDLRYVANKGWVPFRYTIYFEGGLTKQIVIQEADFDHPPDKSVFRLEFPEPIPMINTNGYLRYAPQKSWRLDQLPSASSKATRRIPPSSPDLVSMPPVLPGPREALPAWALPSFVLGMVLILLAAIVYRRRTRAA